MNHRYPQNRNLRSVLLSLVLTLAFGLQPTSADTSNIPPQKPSLHDGVLAQNPGSELWREVRRRDGVSEFNEVNQGILLEDLLTEIQKSRQAPPGTSQVKQVDSGVLINAEGRRWANFRMTTLADYSGYAVAAVFAILVVFYSIRGPIKIEAGASGQMVHRYTDFERITHWTLAIVFLFLAITGLILLLGRPVLMPLLRKEFFALLVSASKEGHNLFGPLFLVSLVMMFISFARHNLYEKGDLTWVLRLGGVIGKGHLSVGFFNSGEKIWFWSLMLIGLVVCISGLVLVFPNFGQGRIYMELSHIVHTIGALVLICFSLGHMYMGSVGMEGASEGMKTGYVDINWADEHHDRWGKRCHEENLIVPAEEYARMQGQPVDSAKAATEQGK